MILNDPRSQKINGGTDRDVTIMFNKKLKDLKYKQTKMNSTMSKMKNALEKINSRIMEAEE